MAKFVFTYRMPPEFMPGKPETLAAWAAWFGGLGDQAIDQGLPTHGATTVGECGAGSSPIGYSVVEAENLVAAVAIAERCPALAEGGGRPPGCGVGRWRGMSTDWETGTPENRLWRQALCGR